MPTVNITQNKTLIVNDQESNLALLEAPLKKKGYSQLKGLTDSRQVVPAFRDWHPNFILIDLANAVHGWLYHCGRGQSAYAARIICA